MVLHQKTLVNEPLTIVDNFMGCKIKLTVDTSSSKLED